MKKFAIVRQYVVSDWADTEKNAVRRAQALARTDRDDTFLVVEVKTSFTRDGLREEKPE